MRPYWLLLALLCLLFAGPARATQPVVEFYEGTVNSSERVVGMGGAFVAVADGAEGHLVNPAAFAVRPTFGRGDWFDWDFAFSAFTVFGGVGTNLDQSQAAAQLDFAQLLQIGADLKFGQFATGVHVRSQELRLVAQTRDRPVTYQIHQAFGGYGFGYGFADGQLTLGGVLSLGTTDLNASNAVHFESSVGFRSLGAVYAPHGERWRIGATVQPTVTMYATGTSASNGALPDHLGALDTPAAIVTPWQAAAGWSYMIGPRAYNEPTTYHLSAAQAAKLPPMPRHYTLLAADVVLFGAVPGAISAQSYLVAQPLSAGRTVSAGLRVGGESEIWANRLALRAGTYYEPSRYDRQFGRLHATAGFDLRVTVWWDWKISYCVDLASGYNNSALGFGFWH